MESYIPVEIRTGHMKTDMKYVEYNQTDLLRFMQYLVKLDTEEPWEAPESQALAGLSNIARDCLINGTTFVEVFCLDFNNLLALYLKNDLYRVLFVLKFKTLPMLLSNPNRLIQKLVQWRLENGI